MTTEAWLEDVDSKANRLDASAMAYFRHQRKLPGNQSTSNKRRSSSTSTAFTGSRPSLLMAYTDYFDRVSHAQSYLLKSPIISRDFFQEQSFDFLNTLVAGQNILLYGPGDHSQQLSSFAKLYLAGEDVIEIDGSTQIHNSETADHHNSNSNTTKSNNNNTISQLQQTHYVSESRTGENAWPKAIRRLLEVIINDILHNNNINSTNNNKKNDDFLLPEDSSLLCLSCAVLAERLDVHYQRKGAETLLAQNLTSNRHTRVNTHNNSSHVNNNNNNNNNSSNDNKNINNTNTSSTNTIDYSHHVINLSDSYRTHCNNLHNHHHTSSSATHSNSATSIHSMVGTAGGRQRGRYAHNQTRLFLVVHHLDGALLQHKAAQQCLAALAGSQSVTLLCACDHLNAPLLWSPLALSAFHWRCVAAPSFFAGLQPLPRDVPFFGAHATHHASGHSYSGAGAGGGGAYASLSSGGPMEEEIVGTDVLVTVLQSVDSNVKELLRLLCRLLCDRLLHDNTHNNSHNNTTVTSNNNEGELVAAERQLRANEVSVAYFLKIASNKLLVKTREEMFVKMRELFDTRLVQQSFSLLHNAHTNKTSKNNKNNGNKHSTSSSSSSSNRKLETLRVMLSVEDIHWIAGDHHNNNNNSNNSTSNINNSSSSNNTTNKKVVFAPPSTEQQPLAGQKRKQNTTDSNGNYDNNSDYDEDSDDNNSDSVDDDNQHHNVQDSSDEDEEDAEEAEVVAVLLAPKRTANTKKTTKNNKKVAKNAKSSSKRASNSEKRKKGSTTTAAKAKKARK